MFSTAIYNSIIVLCKKSHLYIFFILCNGSNASYKYLTAFKTKFTDSNYYKFVVFVQMQILNIFVYLD